MTYWRDESTLLQIRTPSGDGNVLHKYNSGGLLLRTASGDSLSLYEYNDENLLTGVTHTRESKFTLKITLVRNIVNLPKGKYIQIQSRTNAYSRLPFCESKYIFQKGISDSKHTIMIITTYLFSNSFELQRKLSKMVLHGLN